MDRKKYRTPSKLRAWSGFLCFFNLPVNQYVNTGTTHSSPKWCLTRCKLFPARVGQCLLNMGSKLNPPTTSLCCQVFCHSNMKSINMDYHRLFMIFIFCFVFQSFFVLMPRYNLYQICSHLHNSNVCVKKYQSFCDHSTSARILCTRDFYTFVPPFSMSYIPKLLGIYFFCSLSCFDMFQLKHLIYLG